MGSKVSGVIWQTSQTASAPIGVALGNRCYEWSAGWRQRFVCSWDGGGERESESDVDAEFTDRKYQAIVVFMNCVTCVDEQQRQATEAANQDEPADLNV